MNAIYCNPNVDFFFEGFAEGGRGCLALTDIPTGLLLVHAPLASCLFPIHDSTDPEVALVRRIVESLNDRSSDHHEYLKALSPADFSSHPVMWPMEVLNKRMDGLVLKNVYAQSIEKWFSGGILPDTSEYRFATAVMLSRAFAHDQVGIAFVPFADQFNHSSTQWQTRIREDGADGFRMYAEKDILKGEQIFNSYGQVSDAWLFLTHGFTEGPGLNPFNYVSLLLPGSFFIGVGACVVELDADFNFPEGLALTEEAVATLRSLLDDSQLEGNDSDICRLKRIESDQLRSLLDIHSKP